MCCKTTFLDATVYSGTTYYTYLTAAPVGRLLQVALEGLG
jgi:hypothetical protein